MSQSILVVDDNMDLRDLLKSILRRGGYKVETASSGEEGLAALDKQFSPDLVLVDVEMPDMTGPDFLDQIENSEKKSHKEAFQKSCFVYCTAGVIPEDDRVKGSINKMTDLTEFINTVKEILATCPTQLH